MCTHVKGLDTTGVIVSAMHSRLRNYTGAGKWCLLRGRPAAARVLGPRAALHTAAEEAATGISGNTPRCFFAVATYTQIQSLNPQALTVVGTAHGAS